MDDSFDELIIPEEWLKTKQKRSYGKAQADETVPVKLPKLIEEKTNGTDGSSTENVNTDTSENGLIEVTDESTLEDDKLNEPLDNDSLNGNLEAASLSKKDSINSSPATMPFLPIQSMEENNSPTIVTDNTNAPPTTSDVNEGVLHATSSIKYSKPEILKIMSISRDAENLKCVFPDVSVKKIYDMLMEERSKENRLDIVSSKLLELSDKISCVQNSSNNALYCGNSENAIFKDIEMILKEIPTVDGNRVYDILESLPPSSDRVQTVITIIKKDFEGCGKSSTEQNPALLKKESTLVNDPVLKNDPIFRDMRDIAKMFPEKDRNEIYALLEANFTKPNRVEIVVNEFLRSVDKQDSKEPSGNAINIDKEESTGGLDGASVSKSGETDPPLQEDVERLSHLFPDCDPNYLYERLDTIKNNPERCHLLATELFDNKNYPKRQNQNLDIKIEKLNKRDFTIEEFLEKFPDPQKTFGNEEEVVSESYQQHALVVLKNDFHMLKTGYLRDTLNRHRNHLLTSYQEISADMVTIPLANRKHHGRFLKRLRTVMDLMPLVPNEYFYHELWYTRNEQKVQDYLKQKEIQRITKYTEAREKGELYECCCCYDDECLFEDLASCPEGHLFCKVCVVRSTEAAFGEMKNKFPCLTGDCDQYIPLSTLQSIIPANLFSKVVSRIQEEEVQQANIPDLVTCPFCPFATIMPNQDDKVLKCLNPECLKESCRLCQEENHIPLKCNEVESKAGRGMRTYIENFIAEAVMRKCHKCGKKFVKDSGCNKMTCPCGAKSCYACKAQNIDYDHFNGNNKCANTDPNTIHQRDMEQAAMKAKNQYLLDHPEAMDVELPTDFGDWIKSLSNKAEENRNIQDEDEEEELYSSYEEEENERYYGEEEVSSEDDYY